MVDRGLIRQIREYKSRHGYTLYELSRRLDIQVPTLERWLRTERINKVYAMVVRQRLGLL